MRLSKNQEQILLHYVLTCGYGNLGYLTVTVCHYGVLHLHALKSKQGITLLYILTL